MAHIKYLSCFIFPLCVSGFLVTAPHTIAAALAWTLPLWILIVIDWFSPKVSLNHQNSPLPPSFYNAILYGLSVLQLLIIVLLLRYASQLQWHSAADIITSLINLVVMRILVGTSSGSSAIIVAHELIHRSQYLPRLVGKMLLYSVCYEHFVIAHLRGHHLNVASLQDIATARLDESFKAYWKRVTVGHFKYAWQSELQRLELRDTPIYHYKMLANHVLQGLLIKLFLIILIVNFFGWVAAVIFLYQALSAVRLLETINYYQHWGLEQGKKDNVLAWVNESAVTQYALVGLSKHIEHHQNSETHFYQTAYSTQGPKMPHGYFVTNLWVKLNNNAYRRVSADILKQYKNRVIN